ncbi:hypothetical protein CRUP_020466 [Coryphaenoides rupestris]|nr:hypothetical protein CRUP_020466 [Coryphaenoides rupestris]
MGDWSRNLATLSEDVLGRLGEMLDNLTHGWRQLAKSVNEHPQMRCSESELTSCSVQVLSPTGSPARYLLARLADRSCSLAFLLGCLKKMDHQHAVQYLTAMGLSYQWFRGKEQGHYICRVNHGEKCAFSQWAHIRLSRSENSSPGCSSTLFPGSKSGLCITHQPWSQSVTEGDTLFLECRADANPPAQYHWYHNMKALPQQKSSVLRVRGF